MAKIAKKSAKKAAPKKSAKKTEKLGDPIETFNQITETISAMATDIDSFQSGNKSAGRRLRKSAQEIRKACGLFRKEIQNEINNM